MFMPCFVQPEQAELTIVPVYCRHLQRKHPTVYREYSDSKGMGDDSPSSISTFFGAKSGITYSPQNARQKLLSLSLVNNLIIDCALPLSFVDKNSFRKFVKDLDPKFKPPSRSHISLKMLPKLVASKKESVKEQLDSASHVSCTLDMWTDRNCRAYTAVTAHTFVEFQAKSCLLAFKAMPGSHTGAKVAELVESVLDEYGLRSKVAFFVTDDTSNMKKAFTLLSSFHPDEGDTEMQIEDSELLDDDSLWEDVDDQETDLVLESEDAGAVRRVERVPCFGHTLQLVVKDGVDMIGRDPRAVVSKCCNRVSTDLTEQISRIFPGYSRRDF